MTEALHTEVDDSAAPQSVTEGIRETIGAIGNSSPLMIALVALGTLAEGRYVNSGELNRHVRLLHGCPPARNETRPEEEILHPHSYERTLFRAGLVKMQEPQRKQIRDPRRASITPKGQLGMAVAGVLLPGALAIPRKNFLNTALGTYPYIGKPNPRFLIYQRLLIEPTPMKELPAITGLSRQRVSMLAKELVASRICEQEPTPGYGRGLTIALAEASRRHIATLMCNLELVEGAGQKAEEFRERAAQKARSLITFSDHVHALLAT